MRSSDAQRECGHWFRFQSSGQQPGQWLTPAVRESGQCVSWLASFFLCSPLFSYEAQETSGEKSPGRFGLVGFNERHISHWELRPALGVGKDHLPAAYFTSSRLDGER